MGFQAGDANLRRYVGNDPVNKVDPSGLAGEDPKRTWDYWLKEPQKTFNLGNYHAEDGNWMYLTRMERATKAVDGEHSLSTIPFVYPVGKGNKAPPEVIVPADGVKAGDLFKRAQAYHQVGTPATKAREYIRYNLLPLKQDIVTKLYSMLTQTPPADLIVPPGQKPVKLGRSDADYISEANRIADAYIRAVDKFLKDHPGARPKLGQRNMVADALGLQNSKNAPWCADWAPVMSLALRDLNSKYIGSDHVQSKDSAGEHNYVLVRSKGYVYKFGTEDQKVLLFDPWRDLLPRVYLINKKLGSRFVPSNDYVK